MGKVSPKASYKNIQKAIKSSKFATDHQAAKNTFFNRKEKQK